MVEPGLATCNDCKEDFKEDDTIYECKRCEEIFCKDCWDNHNCLEDEGDSPVVDCEGCNTSNDADSVKYCAECDQNICDSCWDEHTRAHVEDKGEEHDYVDYVNEKIKESI